MSLPWVKLHASLLENRAYKRFSSEARLTFLTCLMIAAQQDNGDYSGRLEVAGLGPVTVAEIAESTGCTERRQCAAIDELILAGFLSRDLTGTVVVSRFNEKAAPKGYLSRERMVTKRNRHSDEPVTNQNRISDDLARSRAEAEAENYASLRSAAIGRRIWPTDPEALSALALVFIAAFANCPDPAKGAKWAQAYSSFLAGSRRDGWTIEQTWKACEDCWIAGNRKPLFDNLIARARNHFPPREATNAKPKRARGYDRGADYFKQKLAEKTAREAVS